MQSALFTDCGISQAEIKKLLYATTSQPRVPGWGTAQKIVSDYLLFHLFPTFSPIPHGLKTTRLRKIYILTRNSSLSEENFSPSWRNTLGSLLLDTISGSPVLFTMFPNINFNISPQMMVPFILVPLYWLAQCQSRERERVQTRTNIFQAQSKS